MKGIIFAVLQDEELNVNNMKKIDILMSVSASLQHLIAAQISDEWMVMFSDSCTFLFR